MFHVHPVSDSWPWLLQCVAWSMEKVEQVGSNVAANVLFVTLLQLPIVWKTYLFWERFSQTEIVLRVNFMANMSKSSTWFCSESCFQILQNNVERRTSCSFVWNFVWKMIRFLPLQKWLFLLNQAELCFLKNKICIPELSLEYFFVLLELESIHFFLHLSWNYSNICSSLDFSNQLVDWFSFVLYLPNKWSGTYL